VPELNSYSEMEEIKSHVAPKKTRRIVSLAKRGSVCVTRQLAFCLVMEVRVRVRMFVGKTNAHPYLKVSLSLLFLEQSC
jgi:hypothetical protein